ncbi:MAG TPA: class I SAM-dependent methyltransferase [Roseiflexaceae bacterium]|nr:class I SAM-dependent methyltransferase [Roseiflexaceae bacterium]
MDCCSIFRTINSIFDERTARAEVKRYWRKGLDRHARRFVAALLGQGVAGASLLEVGAGIGGLHAQLLKQGAARATDVDISAAYLAAAQSVAERLGIRERVEYRQADFASAADELPAADVVIMHRVVCCYPNMPTLVAAAARHADRLLALSYPRADWYLRLGRHVINAAMWLQRSGFRFYVHEPAAIRAAAAAEGLMLARQVDSWPWRVALFERA